MRRAPLFVITGAVAGFAGLIGLHAATATPAAQASGTGPDGRSAAAGSATGKGHPASPSAGQPPAAAAGQVRTATGPSENFGYGTIAVKVTVRGNRIIAASVSALTTLEPASQQISGQAIPVLRSEVLAAHSANINAVSGATYTSQGYYQSLQAALSKLHVS